MDGLEVLHHDRSAFVRIPPEIMLAVKRMEKSISLLKCLCKKCFKRIDRLMVVVQTLEKLPKCVAIDGGKYSRRTCRIILRKQSLFYTSGGY